jgi:predicted Fe-Mo cluster-binding NifX family protein
MGQRAQNLFADQHIEVIVGAPSEVPGTLVSKYLSGQLVTGQNVCDH